MHFSRHYTFFSLSAVHLLLRAGFTEIFRQGTSSETDCHCTQISCIWSSSNLWGKATFPAAHWPSCLLVSRLPTLYQTLTNWSTVRCHLSPFSIQSLLQIVNKHSYFRFLIYLLLKWMWLRLKDLFKYITDTWLFPSFLHNELSEFFAKFGLFHNPSNHLCTYLTVVSSVSPSTRLLNCRSCEGLDHQKPYYNQDWT